MNLENQISRESIHEQRRRINYQRPKTKRNRITQWSIVQDRQKYWSSGREQARNLHTTSRHKTSKHKTPSCDHVLTHTSSTSASTEAKEASLCYSSRTASTHFAPHRANPGKILNSFRQSRPNSYITTLGRSRKFSQKLGTFKRKLESSCKHGISVRSRDLLPNMPGSLYSSLLYQFLKLKIRRSRRNQEQKKRSIDQHLQTLIDTGKYRNQKLQNRFLYYLHIITLCIEN